MTDIDENDYSASDSEAEEPKKEIHEEEHIENSDQEKDVEEKPIKIVTVTTDGIEDTDKSYALLPYNVKKKLKRCDLCGKYFNDDMVLQMAEDDIQCWHCFFWLNYDVSKRVEVDGTYGITIVEYIIKCKDSHEQDKCKRNTDSGGCYLCEYLFGGDITDIKDRELIYGDEDHEDDNFDDEDIIIKI